MEIYPGDQHQESKTSVYHWLGQCYAITPGNWRSWLFALHILIQIRNSESDIHCSPLFHVRLCSQPKMSDSASAEGLGYYSRSKEWSGTYSTGFNYPSKCLGCSSWLSRSFSLWQSCCPWSETKIGKMRPCCSSAAIISSASLLSLLKEAWEYVSKVPRTKHTAPWLAATNKGEEIGKSVCLGVRARCAFGDGRSNPGHRPLCYSFSCLLYSASIS